MRILIFGADGQLGWELRRLALPLGEVTALDVGELDLCDRAALAERIQAVHPGVILNAAAYTAVDRAEAEPELARQVNALAPAVMADSARRLKAVLVHFSTDFVFDGRKGAPYREDDTPNPLSVYGQTKLEGEQAVLAAGGAALVLRTSWLYSLRGAGFVSRMLALSRQQESLRAVTDQVGSPTWARLLAQVTVLALAGAAPDPYASLLEKSGIYHAAGGGCASRYEWAQAILAADPHRAEQVCRHLEPALSTEFPAPAARPAFSALDCSRFETTFNLRLPPWQETLPLAWT